MTKPSFADRCFAAEPTQRRLARRLYESVQDLPLVCPHGHVPPELLADTEARFGNPAELFIIPDHYVVRMLYSQGIPLEDLGIMPRGSDEKTDPRRIWRIFSENFHLFRGTPTGLWLRGELTDLFGIDDSPNAENADVLYDALNAQLARPEFAPRALFERFNVEMLCTTDAGNSRLEAHQKLREEGWTRVLPTFRPDALLELNAPDFLTEVAALSEASGVNVGDYASFIGALEAQRAHFKALGAKATDHGGPNAYMGRLSTKEAEVIWARALAGKAGAEDAERFRGHMLIEFARMSSEDGLVMQLHLGSKRDHHAFLFERFGPNLGADIPLATEWTRALEPLLNAYGAHPNFRLIVFTLDENTYGRELAPLAGHYPALRLGPPWWFFDSVKGMERFLDAVVETAGFYNLVGFNDDARSFVSIPARHDIWRRTTCNWLAGEVVRGMLEEEEALELSRELAYGLAKRAYRMDREGG